MSSYFFSGLLNNNLKVHTFRLKCTIKIHNLDSRVIKTHFKISKHRL